MITGAGGNSSGTGNLAIDQTAAITDANAYVSLTDANASGMSLATISAGSGVIFLTSSGTVTGNGALTGQALLLLGDGGTFNLTSPGNDVITLAADTGSVNYAQTDSLTVNGVNSTVGVTGTGGITLQAGNLLIAPGAGVTAGSGSDVVLAATDNS